MKQGNVYIYGKHAVAEAIKKKSACIGRVFFAHEFDDGGIRTAVKQLGIRSELFTEKNMPGRLSKEVTHQGVIAELDEAALMVPYKEFISALTPTPDTALVVLGELQDPQNVGAIIRSAAAFGIAGVLIPPHNQTPVNGTVVKVSAGMAFSIPLVSVPNVNTVLRDLKERGFWVYGLAGEGQLSLYEESFSKPTVFVVGNEGTGLREKTEEECDLLLTIPMHPQAESLNASASAATVFSHWSKQHLNAIRVHD